MISFHFVSLTCWTQRQAKTIWMAFSCDFLSFCIFDMLNTTVFWQKKNMKLLWFPFILYLWHVEHNTANIRDLMLLVVISFHFVSLTCWTQQGKEMIGMRSGCDFLSFCIFDMLNTTLYFVFIPLKELWFPFILYLWHVEHNLRLIRMRRK